MAENKVFKVKKPEKYTPISNDVINDKRLSWAARGVLVYLLSKPNNWQVRNSDLLKQAPGGTKKLEAIIAELKNFGYLRRVRHRTQEGILEWTSEVYESPKMNPEYPDFKKYKGKRISIDESTIPPKQVNGEETIPPKPSDGFPPNGFPSDGFGGIYMNTDSEITESQITDLTTTEHGDAVVDVDSSKNLKWKWIDEPVRTDLFKLPHCTPDYVDNFEVYYHAGRFPKNIKTPVGWLISLIKAAGRPPAADSGLSESASAGTFPTNITGLKKRASDNPIKKQFNPWNGETYYINTETGQRVDKAGNVLDQKCCKTWSEVLLYLNLNSPPVHALLARGDDNSAVYHKNGAHIITVNREDDRVILEKRYLKPIGDAFKTATGESDPEIKFILKKQSS